MGLRLSFFSTPQHRVFNYRPRYYDPHKERLEQLYEKYGKTPEGKLKAEAEAREEGIEPHKRYVPGESIRGSFQRSIEENRATAGNAKIKTLLALITIAAAFVVVYYLAEGFLKILK